MLFSLGWGVNSNFKILKKKKKKGTFIFLMRLKCIKQKTVRYNRKSEKYKRRNNEENNEETSNNGNGSSDDYGIKRNGIG